MTKINVDVCLGTSCFVMGRDILNELLKVVSQKYGEDVKVASSPCLRVCSINWEHSKAPYVRVNKEIIAEATVEKVLTEIEKQLGNEQ